MSKLIIDNSRKELPYAVSYDSYANGDNAIDIWIKFAKYLKPEELMLLEEIKEKDLDSISQNELSKYQKIKKQIAISKLLPKYKNKECTEEEHNQVVEFMNSSLSKFVKSKLTEDEMKLASEYISKLEEKNQLKDYIETQQKIYESLNVYDAYILFEAKEKLYRIEQKKLTKKIEHNQKENYINLINGLVEDYAPKF